MCGQMILRVQQMIQQMFCSKSGSNHVIEPSGHVVKTVQLCTPSRLATLRVKTVLLNKKTREHGKKQSTDDAPHAPRHARAQKKYRTRTRSAGARASASLGSSDITRTSYRPHSLQTYREPPPPHPQLKASASKVILSTHLVTSLRKSSVSLTATVPSPCDLTFTSAGFTLRSTRWSSLNEIAPEEFSSNESKRVCKCATACDDGA